MRWRDQLRAVIGAAQPVSGGQVAITRVADGTQVASGITGVDGWADQVASGAQFPGASRARMG